MSDLLTSSQIAAIEFIEEYARTVSTRGQCELANVLAMSNISKDKFEEAQCQICTNSRVALHFHPDRISRDGRTVAQALFESGTFHNQFETHLSNGRLDPQADGLRAKWEDSIFGGAFSAHASSHVERPKYGALDLMLFPDGPSPRYGSCYLLLKPSSAQRCTFTYMDSHTEPTERGTVKVFEPIVSALMTECFERRFALGRHNISPGELVQHILTQLDSPIGGCMKRSPGRNLNHYIEAQVHGDIFLARDTAALIGDPCFKGTKTEEHFQRIADKYGIELLWHGGFRMKVNQVPEDFRGPGMPSLAQRISCGDDYVDARHIGEAAQDLQDDPSKWVDRGPYESVAQELKCLWHVLVQFGEYGSFAS